MMSGSERNLQIATRSNQNDHRQNTFLSPRPKDTMKLIDESSTGFGNVDLFSSQRRIAGSTVQSTNKSIREDNTRKM